MKGNRKLYLSGLIIVSASVLLALKLIDEDTYLKIIGITAGSFAAGNIVEHVKG